MRISSPMKVAAVLACLLSSCGGSVDELAGGVGSNTNWLTPCLDGSSCGEGLSCLCGVCTTTCSNTACSGNTECVNFASDVCATTPEPVCLALCSSNASCVDSLGAGFTCVSGRCEAPPRIGAIDNATGADEPMGAAGDTSATSSTVDSSAPEERIVEIGVLTNSPPPPECVAGLPALLPGCDPSVNAYTGIDCDGDGVADHRVWRCEVASAERATDFGGNYDCDASDPGLRYWVTPDADGDGFGNGQPFCAGPNIPVGYVPFDGVTASDCDDQNADVHPGALETWGDGTDSDCSGSEGPGCNAVDGGLRSHVRAVTAVSRCAGGPDLYLSTFVHCGGLCPASGAFYAFVGNAGTVAAPGPIMVTWSDAPGASASMAVSLGGLAPGETTEPFQITTIGTTHLELSIDFDDCDPDNGKFVDDNPYGNQICL